MATEVDVSDLVVALAETAEGTLYGTRAWYVAGRVFLRLHEQPGVLMVWCTDEHEKRSRLAQDDKAYFTLPHYDRHASVLVRLDAVDRPQLEVLVTDAYRARAPRRLLPR